MPDFEYWSKRELWTLIEAACLLAGIEPVDQSPKTFRQKLETGEPWITIYNDLKDAVDLGMIEFQESRTGHIGNRRIQPAKCLVWASKRGCGFPSQLRDLVPSLKGAETADQRRERIEAALAEEKKKGTKNFTAVVAQREKVTPGRIRQIVRPPKLRNKEVRDLKRKPTR